MITVSVALLSGHSVTLELPEQLLLGDLKQIAQEKMGRSLVLVSPCGQKLDCLSRSLESLQLDGKLLSAVTKPGPVIQSNRKASTFTAIRRDGHVVTWGHKFHGGLERLNPLHHLHQLRCI